MKLKISYFVQKDSCRNKPIINFQFNCFISIKLNAADVAILGKSSI